MLFRSIVPWTEAGKGESPFVTVVARFGVPYAAGAVNFVILIAALSAMNSQLYITARMMFSLSRAGHAPARFGRLNANGSPSAAMLLSSAGIGIAAALNAAFPDSAFTLMISVSMFGAMFTWLMIFVTHLFFRRVEQPIYRMPGFPYTSILGATLMAAILISTAFTSEFRWTLAFGLPSLGLFALAFAARRKH